MMVDEHLISLQPGTVIAGRYEVIKCLGSGNMGLVYACRHRELSGHTVAVKVLFPEVAQDKIAAARFRNEIFASYGVSHPNVVRAYEYLRDGELLAYTMEYVGGGDLADRLGSKEALIPIPEIVQLLMEISSGLQAIHDAGIVHRDMKPENILLTKDGHVKIADFGIARTGTGPRLTEHGGVVGTIEYVSPEYMLNSQVDWRSDIYALGIIGYEMITGEAAFQGESVYATMTKKLKTDPEPPSLRRRECPQELDRIILRAMARDIDQRYQSASALFQDLQNLGLADRSMTPTPSMVRNHTPTVESTYIGPTLLSEDAQSRKPSIEDQSNRYESSEEEIGQRTVGYVPSGYSGSSSMDAAEMQQDRDQWGVTQKTTSSSASYIGGRGAGFSGRSEVSSRQKNAEEDWNQPKSRKSDKRHSLAEKERFERFSGTLESNTRSLFFDLLTLVVAVVLGVGLGFAVLRTLFPDLLKTSDSGVVEIVE